MKIVQCNMGYSGYWIACWRELMKSVELRVYTPETRYLYSAESLKQLPIRVLDEGEMRDYEKVASAVLAEKPDVLLIGGWASESFKSLAFDERLASVPKVLLIDGAWEGSFRQILNRFRLRKFTHQFAAIIVGGKRGRTYARWLGFPKSRIFRSIYGYDAPAFAACMGERLKLEGVWPHRFCYTGRYAPIKGLDVLMKAYTQYCKQVQNPWPLDCYGSGNLKAQLNATEGVVDHGFLQPADLPAALTKEGVFVFPSLHEPWGVSPVEAAGAGLPLICSDMVTSADDVVKEGENGFIVKAGDVASLTDALVRTHNSLEKLPAMGKRSTELAADFAPEAWAKRWMEVFHALGR